MQRSLGCPDGGAKLGDPDRSELVGPQTVLDASDEAPALGRFGWKANQPGLLQQNLGAVGWKLTPDQVKRLDAASEKTPVYPYWHQRDFPDLMPRVVG